MRVYESKCKLHWISSIKKGSWQLQMYSLKTVGGKRRNGFVSLCRILSEQLV